MSWTSVVEGIITGTATAITWVVLLALANLSRNLLLERRLRKAFESVGYAFGENSFGIILHNTTEVSVKVWKVCFSFPNGGFAPLYFSGEKIAPGTSFRSAEQGGAVGLDFDMSGIWEMEKDRVITLNPVPTGAFSLIEYATLINTKRRITIQVTKADQLQDAFIRCRGRWADNSELQNRES
jgi:hypothetical protein